MVLSTLTAFDRGGRTNRTLHALRRVRTHNSKTVSGHGTRTEAYRKSKWGKRQGSLLRKASLYSQRTADIFKEEFHYARAFEKVTKMFGSKIGVFMLIFIERIPMEKTV